jgi:hypothetical protein
MPITITIISIILMIDSYSKPYQKYPTIIHHRIIIGSSSSSSSSDHHHHHSPEVHLSSCASHVPLGWGTGPLFSTFVSAPSAGASSFTIRIFIMG